MNALALSSSYNGAWWFFFTYILLVATSSFIFKIMEKVGVVLLISCVVIYFIFFYFQVYRTNVFNSEIFNWFQRQLSLYGTSLLSFILGAMSLNRKWSTKISQFFQKIKYKSFIAVIGIILLIIIHGIIPNLIVAPFLAIPFIFLFNQIKLPSFIISTLNFLAPHTTNMWLMHMFFYISFFSAFIYSPKYVLLIFLLLVTCNVMSSFVVNSIIHLVAKIQLLPQTVKESL